MTSSIPKIPHGSIPYSQHSAKNNSQSFGAINNKSNSHKSYYNLLREYVDGKIDVLPSRLLSTRILTTNPTTISRAGSALTAEEITNGLITFSTTGQTYTLPSSADVEAIFRQRYGDSLTNNTSMLLFLQTGPAVTATIDSSSPNVSSNSIIPISMAIGQSIAARVRVVSVSPFNYLVTFGDAKTLT